MPEMRSIHMTSHRAIAATTTYRIHWPTVRGSVRFSIRLSYAFPKRVVFGLLYLRVVHIHVNDIDINVLRTFFRFMDVFGGLLFGSHGYQRDTRGAKTFLELIL